MVDIATIFGIAFMVVTLLVTAGLTWLGLRDSGPTTAAEAAKDEDASSA